MTFEHRALDTRPCMGAPPIKAETGTLIKRALQDGIREGVLLNGARKAINTTQSLKSPMFLTLYNVSAATEM